jgi:hypothetical protein
MLVEIRSHQSAAALSGRSYLSDNMIANGIWRQYQYGTGVSSADSRLFWLALVSKQLPQRSINRRKLYHSIQTMQLALIPFPASCIDEWCWNPDSSPSSFCWNDWFVLSRNQGTGILTVDPVGGYLIDGGLTEDIAPTNSCFIVCDGIQHYTIWIWPECQFCI